MAIRVRWLDDSHTLLYYELAAEWHWDEFYNALATGDAMIREAAGTVVALVNVHACKTVPRDTLSHLKQLIQNADTGVRVYIIGANPFVRTIFDLLERTYPHQTRGYRYVNTVDDALQDLAESWVSRSR